MDVCCLKLWYVWKWSDLDTDYCTLCVCLSAVKVLLKCVKLCSCVPFQFCLLLQDVHNDQVQCTQINSKQKTDVISSEDCCFLCFASSFLFNLNDSLLEWFKWHMQCVNRYIRWKVFLNFQSTAKYVINQLTFFNISLFLLNFRVNMITTFPYDLFLEMMPSVSCGGPDFCNNVNEHRLYQHVAFMLLCFV